jgi:hypothetical protein
MTDWFERLLIEGDLSQEWPHKEYVPTFAFTTAREALARHKWELCGQVYEGKDHQYSDQRPTGKRVNARIEDGIIRTSPPDITELESGPYRGKFRTEDDIYLNLEGGSSSADCGWCSPGGPAKWEGAGMVDGGVW